MKCTDGTRPARSAHVMSIPRKILILGIGSPFGTDRLGWQAVEALEQSGLAAVFPDLEFHFTQSDRPGSGLLRLLQDYDAAILIDAMQSASAAGTIRQFGPHTLEPEVAVASSHGFGVAEALALGYQLGELPKHVVLFGVETGTSSSQLNALVGIVRLWLEALPATKGLNTGCEV